MKTEALDLMRFGAAVAVMAYHYVNRPEATAFDGATPYTDFGYLGVPLFFLLSGFVITASAGRRGVGQFVRARVVRLAPAYWVAIAITAVALATLGDGVPKATTLAANAAMVAPYVGVEYLDGVYWTLVAEVKFYACIAVLLALGWFRRPEIWLTAWAALVAAHTATGKLGAMGLVISPQYSCYFLGGVAFWLWRERGPRWWVGGVLATSLVCAVVWAWVQAGEFLTIQSTARRVISVLIVGGFYGLFFAIASGWDLPPWKPSVRLAALTYPLYLVHNVAGRLLTDRLIGLGVAEWLAILVTAAAAISVALAISVLAEPPLAAALRKWMSPPVRPIETPLPGPAT